MRATRPANLEVDVFRTIAANSPLASLMHALAHASREHRVRSRHAELAGDPDWQAPTAHELSRIIEPYDESLPLPDASCARPAVRSHDAVEIAHVAA